MHINPDFRTRLRESPGSGGGRFELLPAGDYHMSIQPSHHSSLDLSASRALEDHDCWRVSIIAADGSATTPSTQPSIFHERLWRQYWKNSPWAPCVPTEVVQTLFDFLVLGSEQYEEMTPKR